MFADHGSTLYNSWHSQQDNINKALQRLGRGMTGAGLRGYTTTSAYAGERELPPHEKEEKPKQSGGCGCDDDAPPKKKVHRALTKFGQRGSGRGDGPMPELTMLTKNPAQEANWRFEAAQRGFGGQSAGDDYYEEMPGREGPSVYQDPNAVPQAMAMWRGQGTGTYGLSAPPFPGEKHLKLTVPYAPYRVRANFLGDHTNVKARLARGDKPVTYSDAVAAGMDIQAALSANLPSQLSKLGKTASQKLKSGLAGARDKKSNLQAAMKKLGRGKKGKGVGDAIKKAALGYAKTKAKELVRSRGKEFTAKAKAFVGNKAGQLLDRGFDKVGLKDEGLRSQIKDMANKGINKGLDYGSEYATKKVEGMGRQTKRWAMKRAGLGLTLAGARPRAGRGTKMPRGSNGRYLKRGKM